MFSSKTASIIGSLALAMLATASCPSGQLAIGINQVCDEVVMSGTQCSEVLGEIWDDTCNVVADSGTTSGYCNDSFDNGYSVDCSGATNDESGVVASITDPSGVVYGNCVEQGSNDCGDAPNQFNPIYYCCST
jgi:hypothetical protein